MEFQQVIDQCRTSHAFIDKAVPVEIIENALEQSLKAPNHKFTFPWSYYLLGKETQTKLFNWFAKEKYGAEITSQQIEVFKTKLLNPTMLFIAQKHNSDPLLAKEDYATMSCSVQLMALSLAHKGVSYKWSTSKFTRADFTYNLLGINPDEEEIIGCILIGYPVNPPKERNRPSLSDVLTHCQ